MANRKKREHRAATERQAAEHAQLTEERRRESALAIDELQAQLAAKPDGVPADQHGDGDTDELVDDDELEELFGVRTT